MRGLKRFVLAGVLATVLIGPGSVFGAGALDGLSVPAADPALVFVAPSMDQPNYAARAAAFVQSTVADLFLSAYNDNGGLDVLGLPTSGAITDPNNPNFVYQRFQNGFLFYNATDDSYSVLPLA
jgi:hypothetical protein